MRANEGSGGVLTLVVAVDVQQEGGLRVVGALQLPLSPLPVEDGGEAQLIAEVRPAPRLAHRGRQQVCWLRMRVGGAYCSMCDVGCGALAVGLGGLAASIVPSTFGIVIHPLCCLIHPLCWKRRRKKAICTTMAEAEVGSIDPTTVD